MTIEQLEDVKTGTMAITLLKKKYGVDATKFGADELTNMINLLYPVRRMRTIVDCEKPYDPELLEEFLMTEKAMPAWFAKENCNLDHAYKVYENEYKSWLQKQAVA